MEWNEIEASLTGPAGEPAFRRGGSPLHRIANLFDLFVKGRISFGEFPDQIKFSANQEAITEFRKYIEQRLRADSFSPWKMSVRSVTAMFVGLVISVVFGTLAVLCCRWIASIDRSPPTWAISFGWLIGLTPWAFGGIAICGPWFFWVGYRELRAARKINHIVRAGRIDVSREK